MLLHFSIKILCVHTLTCKFHLYITKMSSIFYFGAPHEVRDAAFYFREQLADSHGTEPKGTKNLKLTGIFVGTDLQSKPLFFEPDEPELEVNRKK